MAIKIRNMRISDRFARMRIFAGKGGARSGIIFLNVTALVDMMTVLVIFLVMQFSATGEMLFISKDMVMPLAKNAAQITRIPILSLDSNGALFFEGEMLVESVERVKENENPAIEILAEKLEDNRRRFEILNESREVKDQQVEHVASTQDAPPIEDPTSAVNVQVDKNIDFAIVKRVLFTCEQAGYNRIRLAVGLDGPSLAELKEQQLEI